mmetsp:Transcript_85655/g.229173  ORF Transcript_85655/g.229173 Transcript_85655/m.229173 type:complete len:217 (-) Transcript_85655:149-799(-)
MLHNPLKIIHMPRRLKRIQEDIRRQPQLRRMFRRVKSRLHHPQLPGKLGSSPGSLMEQEMDVLVEAGDVVPLEHAALRAGDGGLVCARVGRGEDGWGHLEHVFRLQKTPALHLRRRLVRRKSRRPPRQQIRHRRHHLLGPNRPGPRGARQRGRLLRPLLQPPWGRDLHVGGVGAGGGWGPVAGGLLLGAEVAPADGGEEGVSVLGGAEAEAVDDSF